MGILTKFIKSAVYHESLPIRRDVRFNLPAERIADWHTPAGPIFTALLNTFSIVLPIGERFFIDAVRAHRDLVQDPELQKAVTAFIGQEAMHGREHEEYNNALFARSPIAPKFEALVLDIFGLIKQHLPAYFWLSGTIALEHFTALLADSVLRTPELFDGAEQHYANIWRWHAYEETEHKAVAFDVWNTAMGQGPYAYTIRSFGLVIATIVFWGLVIPVFLNIVKGEGKLSDISSWKKAYRYTFGDIGALRKQLGNYIDYFRPNFHPWDHDNREYMQQMEQLIYQLSEKKQ
ncbi:metal-dependent hydrolase [Acinetobacter bereziniae]|uniref:metal-dependent hydrolase n=1 Tax=Acinetobacter bereziniae TaxID=106648 RepID=UPI001900C782|nr:metal-dependent hydrolase [Acinetobacter bereziniae]MBJ8453716.1 metal-dependent hydrolase [Acinetobacter bereziniae]MBJ8458108.1 metal-dependent hydrolase [Acinetobacter bereziniae]